MHALKPDIKSLYTKLQVPLAVQYYQLYRKVMLDLSAQGYHYEQYKKSVAINKPAEPFIDEDGTIYLQTD